MSTRWRDEKWQGEPIKCDQCGLDNLIPVPMSAIFIPFWAIPEHDTPHGGGRCLKSFCASPTQGSLLDEDELPSDPRELLSESEHTELRNDLERLAALRRRTESSSGNLPMH